MQWKKSSRNSDLAVRFTESKYNFRNKRNVKDEVAQLLMEYVICKTFLSSQALDSILKSEHLATLKLIGETVKNKKEAIKKCVW